jgi:hypothetical protein
MSWWSAAKNEKPFTVIGVVADARTVTLEKPDPMLIMYRIGIAATQYLDWLYGRGRDSSEMAEVIRQTIWSVDRFRQCVHWVA